MRAVAGALDALKGFLHRETSAGVVLMACAIIALTAANSPLAEGWSSLWATTITVGVGAASLSYPAWYWINDALMAVFFFVVGLEIKREIVEGELGDRKARILPVVTALGGALVPVGIFFLMGPGEDARRGWAVPMATDIAFVVGCLAVLGRRVPVSLKIMLLSLAVVDDLMAVAVVALFYTAQINALALGGAAAMLGVVWAMRASGVRAIPAYVVVGSVAWLFTLKSGIHPTVAGVALAFMTPAVAVGDEHHSPMHRLEHALHPWVAFAIMPLFALANAGVPLGFDTLMEPAALAIGVGLVVGKPVGITLTAWLAVRAGWARLPRGVSWPVVVGAGCLAGIGFTMSLFIAGLGLSGATLDAAKTGVLAGSAVSMAAGFLLLHRFLPAGEGAAQTAEGTHTPTTGQEVLEAS